LKDILNAIDRCRISRGWTEYELAKRSGIPQSTISSWYRKNCHPSMKSLLKICSVFGITLSQLIETDNEVTLTAEQKELLELWTKFSAEQQACFLELFRSL